MSAFGRRCFQRVFAALTRIHPPPIDRQDLIVEWLERAFNHHWLEWDELDAGDVFRIAAVTARDIHSGLGRQARERLNRFRTGPTTLVLYTGEIQEELLPRQWDQFLWRHWNTDENESDHQFRLSLVQALWRRFYLTDFLTRWLNVDTGADIRECLPEIQRGDHVQHPEMYGYVLLNQCLHFAHSQLAPLPEMVFGGRIAGDINGVNGHSVRNLTPRELPRDHSLWPDWYRIPPEGQDPASTAHERMFIDNAEHLDDRERLILYLTTYAPYSTVEPAVALEDAWDNPQRVTRTDPLTGCSFGTEEWVAGILMDAWRVVLR